MRCARSASATTSCCRTCAATAEAAARSSRSGSSRRRTSPWRSAPRATASASTRSASASTPARPAPRSRSSSRRTAPASGRSGSSRLSRGPARWRGTTSRAPRRLPAPLLTLTSHWAVAARRRARSRASSASRPGAGGLDAARSGPRRRARHGAGPPGPRRGRPPRPAPLHGARSPRRCRRAARSGTSRAPATAITTTSPRRRREARLRAALGGVLRDLPARPDGRGLAGPAVLPFSWPQAADASGPLLRRTVTVTRASARVAHEAVDRRLVRPLPARQVRRVLVQRDDVDLRPGGPRGAARAARASSGESLTPAIRTYSTRIRRRGSRGQRAHRRDEARRADRSA